VHTSIFLAQLLGPFYALRGLAMLIKPEMLRAVVRELGASSAPLFFMGLVGLLGGTAVVLTHNVWVFNWPTIITVIGWLTIIRAVVTIFKPERIATAGAKLLERPRHYLLAGSVDLIVGLVLMLFGYIV
jgi:hypothetical protein